MEKATLNAHVRENKGKGAARTLRRDGSLPAVIYGGGNSTPLDLDAKEFKTFIKKTAGRQGLLDLVLDDKSTRLALLKKLQYHPVHGQVLHVDFQEVDTTKKLNVRVSIKLIGEAIGIKRDKGIMEHSLRQVEVRCLPNDIPEGYEIDVTEVGAGQSLHVSDLEVDEKVKILTDPGEVVVSVMIPAVEEEPTEEEALEEGAEAAEGEAGEGAPEAKDDAASEKKEEG